MFKVKTKKENQKTKGFTLIEALVAFSVLVISFGAFISSTTASMKAFRHVERSHLASKMAKEGMEMIFSKKSNGYMACVRLNECGSDDWNTYLQPGSYEVSSYRYEELLPGEKFSGFDEKNYRPRKLCFLSHEVPTGGSPNTSPTPGSKGRFGYCTGPSHEHKDSGGEIIPGNFYREIVIEDLGDGTSEMDPDGIHVKSIVRWGGTNNTDALYETVLEAYLYAN